MTEPLPVPHSTTRVAAIAHYGDWLTTGIQQVLEGRFQHPNQDGSRFHPRIARAYTFWPYYHFVELHSNGLWHFKHDQLTSPDTLAAMTVHVARPVRHLTVLPPIAPGLPARSGLAYVVSLLDMPLAEAKPLPDRVALALEALPAAGPDSDLLVPIGVGERGARSLPLFKIGHAFVTGASGAGKSNLMQTVLATLLSRTTPERLRVVLVDPKRLEFGLWKAAPHLLGPVARTVEEATAAFRQLHAEVVRRGELMTGVARDLAGYNRRASAPLPYILCMVDECLDLTLQAGERSELTTLMKQTVSMARATGVLLWFSATHGTADMLPRVVKANLSSKFVFRVDDASAAQVAGCPGADKLPRSRPGRMLARLESEPVELQSYWLSDEALATIAGKLAQACPGALSDAEVTLARYAIDVLGGEFAVRKIWEAFRDRGWTNHQVKLLAQRWEKAGWLTPPPGITEARRVTDTLRRLVDTPARGDAEKQDEGRL